MGAVTGIANGKIISKLANKWNTYPKLLYVIYLAILYWHKAIINNYP